MISQNPFYYESIKQYIAAFGLVFDSVTFINDFGEPQKVPLHYSPKQKWLEIYQTNLDLNDLNVGITLPRLGFALTGINFAADRFYNPLSKMSDVKKTDRFMYARVPYDFYFSLYLATVKFEDSLKITEQILPFFTPEFNISVRDTLNYELITDIPIVLSNPNMLLDYEGDYNNKRTIEWELSFTLKGYLYSNIREKTRIKEAIIDFRDPIVQQSFNEFILRAE